MADPAMAPITAGPAPVKNDWIEPFFRICSRCGAPRSTNTKDGANAISAARSPRRSLRRVPDDGDGLDDRARSDLAERDGVEELPTGHPVVRGHRVVLHQRDDDEPAAVGERPTLNATHASEPSTADGHADRGGYDGTSRSRGFGRPWPRATISVTPHPTSTRTRYEPTVAAAMPPATVYTAQRIWRARSVTMRERLPGTSPHAAFRATAGTAAPAPAAAPSTQSGGCLARNTTDNARINASPGTMKQSPPTTAPTAPRTFHAHKMASWVEAGPGRRFVVATLSSNSVASIQPPCQRKECAVRRCALEVRQSRCNRGAATARQRS